jgi:hypothetical protein
MKTYQVIAYDLITRKHEIIRQFKTYKTALEYIKHYEIMNDDYFIEYDIIRSKTS